nr:MAG TPA: hypothetical protein [Caudoviricetes sp.]DAS16241.1 MAG TPA: hypothetical protein [Caudoviricetes sp.]DAY77278.1 MAG TPA: hypothetical protein [Caudoviricetes sp.]DAZ09338.1 MAG TPA: hypothetical protein [Caudoviricetes sp.]
MGVTLSDRAVCVKAVGVVCKDLKQRRSRHADL